MLTFRRKLTQVCPALPFLAFGIWLAWSFFVCGGTVWLSDIEVDGSAISALYIRTAGITGILCLLAAVVSKRVEHLLAKPVLIYWGSFASALGCGVVILMGPFYFYNLMSPLLIDVLRIVCSFLIGFGSCILLLKCAALYSALPPRRVVLYAALSEVLSAAIYFIVIGAPAWAPIPGGPSLVGIISFVGLPLLAALFVCLPSNFAGVQVGKDQVAETQISRPFKSPKPFRRLVVVVIVFTIVVVAVRANVVDASPLGETITSTRLVMVLRMLVAIVFACIAIGGNAEYLGFGKVYSITMVVVVSFVILLPLVEAFYSVMGSVILLMYHVFAFLLWCILAFISYLKHISFVRVFGLAYGGFLLSSSIGWALGVFGFKLLADVPSFILYPALAFVVLACAFILFSEKEFDSLFNPEDKSEASLDDLLHQSLTEDVDQNMHYEGHAEGKGKFNEALESLAKHYLLSNRETDVLRCLAMGYSSSAIAKNLQVSWNTVRTHTRNVYSKLGVHSRQELIELVDTAKNATAKEE